MALGERNAASKVSDAPPGTAGVAAVPSGSEQAADGSAADAPNSARPPVGSATSGSTSGNDGSAKVQVKRPAAASTEHKNPPPRAQPGRRPVKDAKVAAADDKDPKSTAQLAKEAASLEKTGRWVEARAAYQALEKAKGYSSAEALYHQAWNAFQSNATSDAAQLAADAARLPSPFKTRAMLLYGDALFRQGEYVRAKNIYLGVRKNLNGEERGTTIKKIMACNTQLKLPEADGAED
jgi:TolA-binding protein